MMTKKVLCLLFFILLITGYCLSFFFPVYPAKVRLINTQEYFSDSALKSLTQNLNQLIYKNKYPHFVDIYTANFTNDFVPNIQSPDHVNVLILGSGQNVFLSNVKKFDFIFTTTLDVQSFLKESDVEAFYLPYFIDVQKKHKSSSCVLHPQKKNCFYLVIGEQPNVTKILKEKNYSYIFYPQATLDVLPEIVSNLDKVSGIIFNVSSFDIGTLDISPLFLYAAYQSIPMLSNNIYASSPNFNTAHFLFPDVINYYTYDSDISYFLDCLSCRLEKVKKAMYLMKNVYSSEAVAKRIMNVILTHKDDHSLKNVFEIFSPTFAGMYNNGDYWISKDLEYEFDKLYRQATIVFPFSLTAGIGDAYLYIRGGIPLRTDKKDSYDASIYYLLFPSFKDENHILSIDDFVKTILPEFDGTDVVAVASTKIADMLRALGVKTYFVPQFTNTQKFYPDFRKELQEDVLFVGNYLPYRRAALVIKNAGLPITIYGDHWPKGMAKSPYIDNRILRQYYSSAKIILNDTKEGMKQYGFIINRIFDATACGTLVISDYMKEIEDIYGDSVPMWKTEKELVDLVKYYLDPAHENERKEKAERARQITLKTLQQK